MEFQAMPKMARLSREVVITEKIDGTNASILIFPQPSEGTPGSAASLAEWEGAKERVVAVIDDIPTLILAGSRTRWVTPKDDNYGWAAWVKEHADELVKLGPGHHFGEWWGRGINRNYGLEERRFSLFNVDRWTLARPACCHVVPVLWRGELDTLMAYNVLTDLGIEGSSAAPGFMDPEGIVVYHTAANLCFKKTIKGDAAGKSYEGHVKKERPPRPQRDPSRGGRRIMQVEIAFPGRRKGDV